MPLKLDLSPFRAMDSREHYNRVTASDCEPDTKGPFAGALVTTLTSPHKKSNGEFGYSVATSGKPVVVGAPFLRVSGLRRAGEGFIY